MKKTDLIKAVSEKTGVSVNEAAKVVNATIEVIVDEVKDGYSVGITGFGTFERSYRNPHKGRNPQTGEEILIEGKYVPVFRAGASFKDAVN